MQILNRFKFIFCFILFFILLQADLFLAPTSLDYARNADENWYAIVLNRLETLGCEKGLPVTFLFPDRRNFHTCEFFKVLNSLSPVKDPMSKVAFLKIAARFLTLALTCLLSYGLLSTPYPGLILGAWYFLDPGLESFKPGIALISNLVRGDYDPFTQASRFISPMHYVLPGLAASVLWIKCLIDFPTSSWKKGAIIASLFGTLYFLSLTPFYTWLPFLYIFGCFTLYAFYFSDRKVLGLCLFFLIFLLSAVGIHLKAQTGFPFEDEVLLRSAFFKHNFDPIFAFHKGLIVASIAIGGISYRIFGKRILPALFTSLGLYCLMNVNVFTGYELQNFHFKDYLGPFVFFTLFFFRLEDGTKEGSSDSNYRCARYRHSGMDLLCPQPVQGLRPLYRRNRRARQ